MNLTTGQRISVRGEEFIITDTRENRDGTRMLDAEGVSELVKGRRFVFDTAIDTGIQPLDPARTILVADTDAGYRKTKLFLETQIRNSPVFSDRITIARKAAIDIADYQLTPTLKAFRLMRPRILIADGVGLGKTIETGIFLSEMIRRGRGKRIMVLAPKSILAQFQQEMWHRFAIPLMRLDSEGIARIRTQLPANKNPFEYYDKTIVSIDTLKNNAKFRHHLERSTWDIVVVDECHAVANDASLRGELAQLMARRCESLVLASATPHNGRRESFANLIDMIEPTAIPRDRDYGKAEVEPYYVRRFKNDIGEARVLDQFRDREVVRHTAALGPEENAFLKELQALKFKAIRSFRDGGRKDDFLFAVGIFKAFLSSPPAAVVSIGHRIDKLTALAARGGEVSEEMENLQRLRTLAEAAATPEHDGKYRTLRSTLQGLGWKGREADERLVVFAERIETLRTLEERLRIDFKLRGDTLGMFHGSLTDTEQQQIIDDFGKEDSHTRLLLCSDAGSQGVNLHFFCHRMFNYDIPWSLITLEQRNGRIDRYGQTTTPFIHYLVAESDIEGLRTDLHIIDRITRKEEEVYRTLGDPGSVMRLYDARREERYVEEAILHRNEDFLEEKPDADADFDYSVLFAEGDTTPALVTDDPYETPMSVFPDDFSYYRDLFEQLRSDGQVADGQVSVYEEGYVEVTHTPEIERILYDMPPEAKPGRHGYYRLTIDRTRVQQAIRDARRRKGEWAGFQLLWDLHPIVRHFMTKLEAGVPKGRALTAQVARLPPGTAWYVLHAQVSNNLGQPVVADFIATAVKWDGSIHTRAMPLRDFISGFGIDGPLLNLPIDEADLAHLTGLIPDMLEIAGSHMLEMRWRREREMDDRLEAYRRRIDEWGETARRQVEAEFEGQLLSSFREGRRTRALVDIDEIRERTSQYNRDLHSLQGEPYYRILAVFYHKA
jgi:ERCC4-related helicase